MRRTERWFKSQSGQATYSSVSTLRTILMSPNLRSSGKGENAKEKSKFVVGVTPVGGGEVVG